MDGARRQADGLPELTQRAADIVLEQVQQGEVDLVRGTGLELLNAIILRLGGTDFNRHHACAG